MAREGKGGLGFADRLILLVAWIVTCGLVYFLGFYVGNSTQVRRLGLEERVVRLPVTSQPPPEGTRPKSEDQFVFYDKLMGDGAAARDTAKPSSPTLPVETSRPTPPPAAAPARAATPPSPPSAAPSSTKQLASTTPPSTPAHPPAPMPPRPVHATAEVPVQAAPPREVAKASAAPAPTPPPTLAVASPSAGSWTVLANPTRNRDEADQLSRQLRSRGYEATLVRVVRDGDTWYRVQVGRFPSAEAAAEVMHRLRDHEGVPHAFVASE
jgi:cell division septation protein DedD